MRTKIVGGFATVSLVFVGAIVCGYWALQGALGSYEALLAHQEAAKANALGVNSAMLEARRSEKDFLLHHDMQYPPKVAEAIDDLSQHAKTLAEMASTSGDTTGAQAAQDIEQIGNAYLATFNTLVESWQQRGLTEDEELQGKFRTAAHTLETELGQTDMTNLQLALAQVRRCEKDYLLRLKPEYVEKTRKAVEAFQGGLQQATLPDPPKTKLLAALDEYGQAFGATVAEDKKIAALTATMRDTIHKLEPIVAAATERAQEAMTIGSQDTQRTGTRDATITLIAAGAAVILAALSALVITRSITGPVNRIVATLWEGAAQVNAAAGQVATSAQQLAAGASQQASSLEETSSALEEMAASTRANAGNAHQANELSGQARAAAQAGDQTMAHLNQAMSRINDSSGEISKVIKVIEEIAFQTNLLALNAAVEAARAGEHGKGFAVVADEVRNLAQRAAQASREVTGLIEESVTKAHEGTTAAGDVAKALGGIAGDVTKVADLIDGISRASQEQAEGVEQLNTAVAEMDKVTQQNAAGAEESASAAEELSAQATTIKSIVDDLAGLIHGAAARHVEQQAGSAPAAQRTPVKKASHRASPPPAKPPKTVEHAAALIPHTEGDLSAF